MSNFPPAPLTPISPLCRLPQYQRQVLVPIEPRQTKSIVIAPTILHRRVGAPPEQIPNHILTVLSLGRIRNRRPPMIRQPPARVYPIENQPQPGTSALPSSQVCWLRRKLPQSLQPGVAASGRSGRHWRRAA